MARYEKRSESNRRVFDVLRDRVGIDATYIARNCPKIARFYQRSRISAAGGERAEIIRAFPSV